MKIVSLNVKAFGKLSNVSLNFKNGLNVIANVNGFGKTTMASFIRAMLYGFTYSRNKGLTDAAHYAPWGSDEKFGGSMTVEHNGETYRIERFFGKAARSEQLTVTNAKTNKQVDIPVSPGEYFLGLTAESYDRSAYFPQEAVELSTNDNFEAKLANLVENGDVDYDKTQKNLRDYRRTLKLEKGNGGQIYELAVKQRQYQQELFNAERAKARAAEIDERLNQIDLERKQANGEQSACKRELDAVNKRLGEQSLSQADQENLSKLSALEAKIARIPSEIEQDKLALDELNNAISNVKEDVKPRIYPNLPILIASVVLAIAGIVLCFVVPQPWNFVSGILLIVLGVIGAVVAFTRKGAKTLPAGEKDALISQYYRIASKYIYTQDLDYNGVIKEFWRFYGDYVGDKRELEALRGLIKRPSSDVDKLQEQKALLERKQEDVADKLTRLAGEEGRLSQERKALSFDSITPSERIEQIGQQIQRLERRYEVADTVSKLLAEAKERLSSSYLPRLCERCQTLLCEVTNGGYEVAIDRAFNVQLRENGQTKPISEFSRGIREITLLCFRVALSELLYDGNIPFVIVDDAFVNFDEDNFVRATDLLKSIARHGQVIYFTCHRRMGNLLKNS